MPLRFRRSRRPRPIVPRSSSQLPVHGSRAISLFSSLEKKLNKNLSTFWYISVVDALFSIDRVTIIFSFNPFLLILFRRALNFRFVIIANFLSVDSNFPPLGADVCDKVKIPVSLLKYADLSASIFFCFICYIYPPLPLYGTRDRACTRRSGTRRRIPTLWYLLGPPSRDSENALNIKSKLVQRCRDTSSGLKEKLIDSVMFSIFVKQNKSDLWIFSVESS